MQRKLHTLAIAAVFGAVVGLRPAVAVAVSVGPADLFNVYALGNIGTAADPYDFSEFGGISGAGGNAYLDNFFANSTNVLGPFGLLTGNALTLSNATVDRGISSGGPISLTNVQVNGNLNGGSTLNVVSSTINGNLRTAGAVTGSGLTVTGSTSTGPYTAPIDVTALNNSLLNASNSFAALSDTGTAAAVCGGGGCTLTLTGVSGQNVFDVNLAGYGSPVGLMNFAGPSDATFIVDLIGTNVALSAIGFNLAAGVGFADILWNAAQATSLLLSQIGLPGTLLAPNALVNFTNASIDGNLYAGNLVGNGESHVVPEPGTWAMLLTGLLALVFARRGRSIFRAG
jgi:choice-of-anchor A domain-containing protein